jgi:hypothetical protein
MPLLNDDEQLYTSSMLNAQLTATEALLDETSYPGNSNLGLYYAEDDMRYATAQQTKSGVIPGSKNYVVIKVLETGMKKLWKHNFLQLDDQETHPGTGIKFGKSGTDDAYGKGPECHLYSDLAQSAAALAAGGGDGTAANRAILAVEDLKLGIEMADWQDYSQFQAVTSSIDARSIAVAVTAATSANGHTADLENLTAVSAGPAPGDAAGTINLQFKFQCTFENAADGVQALIRSNDGTPEDWAQGDAGAREFEDTRTWTVTFAAIDGLQQALNNTSEAAATASAASRGDPLYEDQRVGNFAVSYPADEKSTAKLALLPVLKITGITQAVEELPIYLGTLGDGAAHEVTTGVAVDGGYYGSVKHDTFSVKQVADVGITWAESAADAGAENTAGRSLTVSVVYKFIGNNGAAAEGEGTSGYDLGAGALTSA